MTDYYKQVSPETRRPTMDEALRVAVVALRELAAYTSGESPEPEDVVVMREHARSALARIDPEAEERLAHYLGVLD